MPKWFSDDHPEVFAMLREHNHFLCFGTDEQGKPINCRPKNPEAQAFFAGIEPWERHTPVSAENLALWRAELASQRGNSYGQLLARDIKLAEECNARGSEMIVSFKRQPGEDVQNVKPDANAR